MIRFLTEKPVRILNLAATLTCSLACALSMYNGNMVLMVANLILAILNCICLLT